MSGRLSRPSGQPGLGSSPQRQEPLPPAASDTFLSPSPSTEEDASQPRPIRTHSATGYYTLASSYGNRAPGRSFSQFATHGSLDQVRYASPGVRETTQEIASMALADPTSFRPSPSSRLNLASDSDTTSRAPSSSTGHTRPPRDSLESGREEAIEEVSEPVSPEDEHGPGPHAQKTPPQTSILSDLIRKSPPDERKGSSGQHPSSSSGHAQHRRPDVVVEDTDQTPLLSRPRSGDMTPNSSSRTSYGTNESVLQGETFFKQDRGRGNKGFAKLRHSFAQSWERGRATMRVVRDPKSWNARSILKYCVIKPAKPLPAVFVGLLLNILDGLSYGLILFPTAYPIFAKTAPDGISIFFVSCIVSQLIYSLGGSIFKGAVGSEMIEVVPFFHKMAILIMNQMGEDHPAAILSTVITSYAISSIITGAIFFVLGILKLGNLVNFFPRSITAGCIGGVGLFLILTGIEVSAQLEGDFEFSKETFQELFQGETIAQWIIPIALAVLLIVIRARWHSTFVLPAYIIAVIAIFYIIFMGIVHRDMTALRETTWVFQKPETGVPFYNFYSYYRFDLVGWGAIAKTLPTMFALSFFGIIHVPINVPALGMFTREDDVDLNREFIAHGVSNALSGAVGSIQNYLVYANSVLFIENGGNSRLAGIELAIATTAIWMVGPGPIGYIPVMVVGILIYMLGIELMSEALWDTFGKVHKLEYLMIVIVVFVMGIYDFVVGIAVGIILACAIYVVQTAQKSAIRGSYSGEIAESTVRRHPVHRQFLHQAGRQIYLTKLAGYLFFGSVVAVENRIRQLIDEKSFSSRPIRYLIFDFSHVTGIDYSAAESFNTMNRILRRKDVEMVLSSVATSDDIGRSFTMVGLLDEETGGNEAPPPKVFEDLNGALEHCENELLMAAKMRADMAAHKEQQSQPHNIPTSNQNGQPFNFDGSFNSPRRQLIHQAATHTFNQPGTTFNEHNIITPTGWRSLPQPLLLILQTFRGLSDKDLDFWSRVVPFFEKRTLKAGDVLYRRGDVPDGFYLLESGLIHVEYELEQGHYYETIVPGTTFGELPFFGDTDRTGTVACERDCVVWCLTRERWGGLQRDERTADVALELLKIGFKLTSERMNAITSYVLVTAT